MTVHAIKRAKERYGVELTFEDLKTILNEILEGNAKQLARPKNIFGLESKGDVYNIRYKGVLMQPIVYENLIITFRPVGKGVSWKKYQEIKTPEDFKSMLKRKKIK